MKMALRRSVSFVQHFPKEDFNVTKSTIKPKSIRSRLALANFDVIAIKRSQPPFVYHAGCT